MKGIVQCSENYQKISGTGRLGKCQENFLLIGFTKVNDHHTSRHHYDKLIRCLVVSLFQGDDKFFWHAWSNSPYKIM